MRIEHWRYAIPLWLRSFLRPSDVERDLDDELHDHIERQTAANVAAGMTPAEARRAALVAFGGVERVKDESRDTRKLSVVSGIAQLRHAARSLARARIFTVAVIGTIALGVGAGSAIATVINAVLLRPLPYPDSDRLVALWHSFPGIGISLGGQSTGTYALYKTEATSFESIGAYSDGSVTVSDPDDLLRPDRVPAPGQPSCRIHRPGLDLWATICDYRSMASERRFSTAEVAERVGVHRDTLLRWLREGRVAEPRRDRNGWRTFTSDEVRNIERFARAERASSPNATYHLRRSPSPMVRETATPIGPIERLRNLDWDFVDAKTNYLTHGLHPYPAKFIPQIPNALIQELSSVGEVVADVFCGSGTTLVEALTLKRHAIGVDANPLACLITEAKTTPLQAEELGALRQLVLNSAMLGEHIADTKHQGGLFTPDQQLHRVIPESKAIQFWFEPFVIDELAQIRSWMGAIASVGARNLARVALSSIIVAVSRQDSDTRYVRRQKNLAPGDVLKRFSRALEGAVRKAAELTDLLESRFSKRVVNASVLDAPDIGAIDLVVSSPPYPNAYSYHLYHMTRMLWLEMDQPTFKRAEIGSHRKYSAKGPRAATHDTFLNEMDRVFAWLATHLKSGRFACFVVGDSIIGGRRYNNADTMAVAAAGYGFTEIARIERRLQDTKKAFNPAIGKIRQEHILIVQNRGDRS